jgi:phosphatidylserine/phosphatidylglycerophosphate/cardiolipin synthase-like enzyme
MNRARLSILSFILLAVVACYGPLHAGNAVSVCFSPGGHCTDVIVKEIQGSRSSILVQAYGFTSAPIAKALLEAHKRGVKVHAILDKSNRTDKYSGADFLCNAGVPVLIDGAHAIAHNKVMVIDGEIVITGSFNFTKAAEERNAENLLVIRDKDLAEKYSRNWNQHATHSEVYQRKSRERTSSGKPAKSAG